VIYFKLAKAISPYFFASSVLLGGASAQIRPKNEQYVALKWRQNPIICLKKMSERGEKRFIKPNVSKGCVSFIDQDKSFGGLPAKRCRNQDECHL